MSKNRGNKKLDKLTNHIINDLSTYKYEVLRAHKEYQLNPNPKTFKQRELAIQKYREKLKETSGINKTEYFNSWSEAFRYLKALAYKISRSRFFERLHEIPVENGKISREALESWAKNNLDIDLREEEVNYQEEKRKEELRKLKAEAELYELKLQKLKGELINREIIRDILIARATFFLEELTALFNDKAEDLAMETDPEKIKLILLENLKTILRKYIKEPKIKTEEVIDNDTVADNI